MEIPNPQYKSKLIFLKIFHWSMTLRLLFIGFPLFVLIIQAFF